MKLTYWVSERLDDSEAYSLRGKRRRDVLEQLAEHDLTATGGRTDWGGEYGPAHKVEVEYSSVFNLLEQCLGSEVYEGSSEERAQGQAFDQQFEGAPADAADDDEREYGPADKSWYA